MLGHGVVLGQLLLVAQLVEVGVLFVDGFELKTHFKQNEPQRVDIHFEVVVFLVLLLGGGVERGAQMEGHGLVDRQLAGAVVRRREGRACGESEVPDDDVPLRNKYIGRSSYRSTSCPGGRTVSYVNSAVPT